MEDFEKISMKGAFKKVLDMDLLKMYDLCNSEMAYQQSKRDQIIAFYIAIISFLVPAVLELELANYLMAAVYGVLWFIGWILSSVVRRYRIYKECYWITLRTISTLMRVEPEKLNKMTFQKTFAATLRLNRPNVIIAKNDSAMPNPLVQKESQTKDGAKNAYRENVNYWKTFWKNHTSAEFLLYMLIALISSLLLGMAVYSLADWACGFLAGQLHPDLFGWLKVILALLAVAGSTVFSVWQFMRDLAEVYAYCFDCSQKSFNKPYTKAWFLHCFNSELEPDKNDDENGKNSEQKPEKEKVPV